MKPFLLLLLFTVAAFGKPPLTPNDEAELRHIVSVIQAAANETKAKLDAAEAKAGAAVLQLSAATDALVSAGNETQKVQTALDTRTQERDEARADAIRQAGAKWKWFFSCVGLCGMVAIYVLARIKGLVP